VVVIGFAWVRQSSKAKKDFVDELDIKEGNPFDPALLSTPKKATSIFLGSAVKNAAGEYITSPGPLGGEYITSPGGMAGDQRESNYFVTDGAINDVWAAKVDTLAKFTDAIGTESTYSMAAEGGGSDGGPSAETIYMLAANGGGKHSEHHRNPPMFGEADPGYVLANADSSMTEADYEMATSMLSDGKAGQGETQYELAMPDRYKGRLTGAGEADFLDLGASTAEGIAEFPDFGVPREASAMLTNSFKLGSFAVRRTTDL